MIIAYFFKEYKILIYYSRNSCIGMYLLVVQTQ